MTSFDYSPWPRQRLGDICLSKETVDPRRQPSKIIRYIDISCVSNKTFCIEQCTEVIGADAPSRARKVVRTGDVIFATTRPYLRSIAPITPTWDGAVCSTGFCVIRPGDLLDPRWVYYVAISDDFLSQVTPKMRGANYPAVTDGDVLDSVVPLPPIAEQRRIITRIQKAMARVEEIRRLRAETLRIVQAIRGSAVTETFSDFRSRTKERSVGDLVGSGPGLMASGPFGSQLKHGDFVADGHLVIGIANVQCDWFNPKRKWMVDDLVLDRLRRYLVLPNDLLVTIMGTVGRTCIVPTDIGLAVTSKHVYRIRFTTPEIIPRFVSIAINFDRETGRRLHGQAAGGVMPGLNASKLRELRIPIPSVREQAHLIEMVDRLGRLDEVEAHIASTPEQFLAAAILRRAFAGEL